MTKSKSSTRILKDLSIKHKNVLNVCSFQFFFRPTVDECSHSTPIIIAQDRVCSAAGVKATDSTESIIFYKKNVSTKIFSLRFKAAAPRSDNIGQQYQVRLRQPRTVSCSSSSIVGGGVTNFTLPINPSQQQQKGAQNKNK